MERNSFNETFDTEIRRITEDYGIINIQNLEDLHDPNGYNRCQISNKVKLCIQDIVQFCRGQRNGRMLYLLH